jgi:hypothetical protein
VATGRGGAAARRIGAGFSTRTRCVIVSGGGVDRETVMI